MRIKDIKMLSDDPKVKRLFGYFWEIPEYEQAMFDYRSAEPSAKGLLMVIASVFSKKYGEMEKLPDGQASVQRDDLRSLSKRLYGDTVSWAWDTEFEDREMAALKRAQERNEFLSGRMALLEPLMLKLFGCCRGEAEQSVSSRIANNDEMFEVCSSGIQKIDSVSDLRDICLEVCKQNVQTYGYRTKDERLLTVLNNIISDQNQRTGA